MKRNDFQLTERISWKNVGEACSLSNIFFCSCKITFCCCTACKKCLYVHQVYDPKRVLVVLLKLRLRIISPISFWIHHYHQQQDHHLYKKKLFTAYLTIPCAFHLPSRRYVVSYVIGFFPAKKIKSRNQLRVTAISRHTCKSTLHV